MMKMRCCPDLLINELWYCVRNRRWTNTTDSYLANCSTKKAFSAPVNAIFHKLTSSSKIYKLRFVNNYEWKLGNILFPLIQVFSLYLPWLQFYRPKKTRGDFWLVLYVRKGWVKKPIFQGLISRVLLDIQTKGQVFCITLGPVTVRIPNGTIGLLYLFYNIGWHFERLKSCRA